MTLNDIVMSYQLMAITVVYYRNKIKKYTECYKFKLDVYIL